MHRPGSLLWCTGQLAAELSRQGYLTTGLDCSEGTIEIARKNAPDVEFVVQDARNFALPGRFSAVFSTFDSLNHVMSLDELEQVFRSVFAALEGGGYFVFDLNMEEGFRSRWRGSFEYVEEDHVCVVRSSHDAREKIGRLDVTLFELKGRRPALGRDPTPVQHPRNQRPGDPAGDDRNQGVPENSGDRLHVVHRGVPHQRHGQTHQSPDRGAGLETLFAVGDTLPTQDDGEDCRINEFAQDQRPQDGHSPFDVVGEEVCQESVEQAGQHQERDPARDRCHQKVLVHRASANGLKSRLQMTI